MPVLELTNAGHRHFCPGCGGTHIIPFSWIFNGNFARPTFAPSVKHTRRFGGAARPDKVCHYFLRDGRIEYCGDCTHGMSGQTVNLPALPSLYNEVPQPVEK